jgi:hypothetical protein
VQLAIGQQHLTIKDPLVDLITVIIKRCWHDSLRSKYGPCHTDLLHGYRIWRACLMVHIHVE